MNVALRFDTDSVHLFTSLALIQWQRTKPNLA